MAKRWHKPICVRDKHIDGRPEIEKQIGERGRHTTGVKIFNFGDAQIAQESEHRGPFALGGKRELH